MILNKLLKYGKYLPFINSINNISSMQQKRSLDRVNRYSIRQIAEYVGFRKFSDIIKYSKKISKKVNITTKDLEYIKITETSNNLTDFGIKRLVNTKNDSDKDKIFVKKIDEQILCQDENGENKYCKATLLVNEDLLKDYPLHSYKYLINLDIVCFPRYKFNYKFNGDLYFAKFPNLKELRLECFITSNATSMRGLFKNCYNLETLILADFNTSNVNDMSKMFEGCIKLKQITGIENFNTSKVTDMSNMFAGCHNLKKLDLKKFNTQEVTNMSKMFYECINLKKLNLKSFDISKVTNMSYMFGKCQYLKDSDFIKNLDFSKKNIDTKNMFINTNFENLKFEKDYKFSNNIRCNDDSDVNFSLEYRNINEDLDSFTEKSLNNVNFNYGSLDDPKYNLEDDNFID